MASLCGSFPTLPSAFLSSSNSTSYSINFPHLRETASFGRRRKAEVAEVFAVHQAVVHATFHIISDDLLALWRHLTITPTDTLSKRRDVLFAQAVEVHRKGAAEGRPQVQRGHIGTGKAAHLLLPGVEFRPGSIMDSSVLVVFEPLHKAEEANRQEILLPRSSTPEQLEEVLRHLLIAVELDSDLAFYANDRNHFIQTCLGDSINSSEEQVVRVLWEPKQPAPEVSSVELASPIKCLSAGYAGLYDGSLWTTSQTCVAKVHSAAISCISVQSSSVLCGSLDGKVVSVSLADKKLTRTFSDSQSIAVVGHDFVALWDGCLVQDKKRFSVHSSAIVFAKDLGEGSFLTASWDRRICLTANGSSKSLPASSQSITSACLVNDHLVCGHPDGHVSLVSLSEWCVAKRLRIQQGRIAALCSINDDRFALSADDGSVRIFSVSDFLSGIVAPLQTVSVSTLAAQCLDYHGGRLWAAHGRFLSSFVLQ